MFKDYFLIAWHNVKNRQLRSWLTVLGIIVGVATIVALISLSQGLENAITEQFESLGVSNIRVVPANLRGPPTGALGLSSSDERAIKGIKGVDRVNGIVTDVAQIRFNGEEKQLLVQAQEPDPRYEGFADVSVDVVSGRFFLPSDSGVVIIGDKIAHEIFDKELRVRNSLEIQGQEFKVLGIFERTGTDVDNGIYMVEDDARALFKRPDVVNVIIISVQPGEDMDAVIERIQRRLEINRGKDDFEIFTPAQILDQFRSILAIVQAILVAIAGISLFVGSVGIMNSMFTSVFERTREIGIFKSIGARNMDIFALFVIESGFIGIVGGVFGSLLGLGIAKGIEWGAAAAGFGLLSIKFNLLLMIGSLLFAFVVGMVSGFLPSLRAARLKPVDALRYE